MVQTLSDQYVIILNMYEQPREINIENSSVESSHGKNAKIPTYYLLWFECNDFSKEFFSHLPAEI